MKSSREDKFAGALKSLDEWFARAARVLPWRSEPAPYRVWISEVMLQQTQVATVVPYFDRFVERFPDLHTLAASTEEEVLRYWAGLGYYARGRNLLRAAKAIDRAGQFPAERRDLESLPGIGAYTAGAILSIAFDKPEPILDANVERVLSRLRKIRRDDKPQTYKKKLWRLSACVVNKAHALGIRPSVCNQALMEIGALVCSPKKPDCARCPLASICKAFAAGAPESYPGNAAPKLWKPVEEVVYCLVDETGSVCLARREDGQWRGGLWDFPAELPASLAKLAEAGSVVTRHVVTNHRIRRTTKVYRAERKALIAAGGLDCCLVPLDALVGGRKPGAKLPPVGSALLKTVKSLKVYLDKETITQA